MTCQEMSGDVRRCQEMSGDVRKCQEILGDISDFVPFNKPKIIIVQFNGNLSCLIIFIINTHMRIMLNIFQLFYINNDINSC